MNSADEDQASFVGVDLTEYDFYEIPTSRMTARPRTSKTVSVLLASQEGWDEPSPQSGINQ
ncbi:hypothetical protein VMCG_00860 [Cytospora schulzeri]|uniref:Uncharacterized protein n=1 Tax=Cytospora schulzeri TaxID=448051 RepID=A0A423X5Y2_9PEZI|nr:hypothetical protein VMCG_00860 [Valsa malicola]